MSPKPVMPFHQRLLEDMAVRHFGEKSKHDYLRHIESVSVEATKPIELRGRREQFPQLKVKLPISYRNGKSGFRPPAALHCVSADHGPVFIARARTVLCSPH